MLDVRRRLREDAGVQEVDTVLVGFVAMERFERDDRGYLTWLGRQPGGYVINTTRRPTANYLVLHRATCRTISGTPARGRTWTHGDYIKVCGSRLELERWAAATTGGRVSACGQCC